MTQQEIEFGILGPLCATVDGRPVPVPAAKHRVLLGALLLQANRVVPVSTLLDHLWAGEPPPGARGTVHTYVHRLRRRFGRPDLIATDGDGYLINVPPGALDLHRFRDLLGRADEAVLDADPVAESVHLRAALAVWRGPALADVASASLEAYARTLDEERLRVIERSVDAELSTGRHADLIPELRGLTVEQPLRERFWQQLMLALYRSGRQAEALEAFRAIDRKLRSDLGIEPGADLRALHRAMLAGEVAGPPVPAAPAPRWVAPRQLPADIRGFVGREAALDAMDAPVGDTTVPAVTVIGGPAGVGKTTLAVHWAHRVADLFPDGHLYANLRGFDPGGTPRSASEVLRGFLGAMRVPPHEIPSDPDAQAGLYRSLLSGRRMLVVLDNARDAEQVRPLLPGSAGNMVVVTSRDRLTSLIALDGAHPVTLDVLSVADATHLLNGRIGARRVDADPAATAEVIGRCAALPLALTVVAARAALQPESSLGMLAAQIRGAQADLSVFQDPDPAADLRAVFSWSFQTISPAAARLFRLLGLHPGPDIGERAAASLSGVPLVEVRPLLAELATANVIAESSARRYSFHDLLRAFAIEQAGRHETEPQRRDAMGRLVDHYVHSGYTAARLLNAQRDPITVAPHRPGVTPEPVDDDHRASEWFVAEHAVLLAMIPAAAAQGFDVHAWQLAWVFADALDRRGFWHEIIDTQLVAIAAADRLADRRAGAQSRRNLSRGYGLLSRYDEALAMLNEALDLYSERGNDIGRANTHRAISWILGRQDRVDEAIVHATHAMRLFRAGGDRAGQGRALNSLGWMHSRLGRHRQAVVYCEESLRLQADGGGAYSVAVTWDTLGFARYHLGQYDEAITCLQRAVDLLGEVGARYSQANALAHLGDAHIAAGDAAVGRRTLQRAVDILREIGHADADRVQDQLAGLSVSGA
ncbi:AfsR/SARP family transcriptional regulator [Virgisporangium aurantiacum]|uniref:SARP family transcriptional regulator n=1 Tax=Virgisporangium aurantiacum TaxID=175570 RepID=A0A8J4E122_9ACTN|nr:BTAD domain-containing putative transcriptional regulator [Virgisporangium aurantiacum]GIJ57401.1 SARP family transcriptional regulator [Virgisporangium aurantiacum]